MRKKFKIEDVDIDKLSQLLIDFFEEEKEEGVHNSDNVDILTDEDDVTVDVPLKDEDDTDIEDEDDVMVDVPLKDEDDTVTDEDDTDIEDEDDVMVDVPLKDEDDTVADEDDTDINVATKDTINKTVDSAIRSYKQAHAKTMVAYDEVSQIVGTFKTYDTAGNMMSEKGVYKLGCKRLGLDKIEGITDYKSAFKAASYIRASYANSVNEQKRTADAFISSDEVISVDKIINNAFRQ